MRLSIPPIGPAVVSVGVFDGVHRGHRHLLAATRSAAQARGASAVALVFSPHPDEVMRPGSRVPRLLPPDETLDRLRQTVDQAVVIGFDDALRSLTPAEFLDALAPGMELRGITMTPGSAFGRGRAGTPDHVAQIGAERGFDVIRTDPLLVDGREISSSRIRELLASGDVSAARDLLGSNPMLRGTVVHGDERGRQMGYPTANLAFDYTAALPALGIYLGSVAAPERSVGPGHPALVSVGVRPTFHDGGGILVEAYLLDWDGDLYDASLTVQLEQRLREERRFASADELVTQMRADEIEARRRLAAR